MASGSTNPASNGGKEERRRIRRQRMLASLRRKWWRTFFEEWRNPRNLITGLLLFVCGIIALCVLLWFARGIHGEITSEGGKVNYEHLRFYIGFSLGVVGAVLVLIAILSVAFKGHLAAMMGLLALVSLGISVWVLLTPEVNQTSYARGLITVVFALGTISIALILVLSVLFGGWKDPEEMRKRFTAGKEVLTVLLGILGTVVGFYFGSATEQQQAPLPVTIKNFSPAPGEEVTGDSFTLTFEIEGGTAPYYYTVEFQDEKNEFQSRNNRTFRGRVEESIPLPTVTESRTIGVKIMVRDSRDRVDSVTIEAENGIVLKPS